METNITKFSSEARIFLEKAILVTGVKIIFKSVCILDEKIMIMK